MTREEKTKELLQEVLGYIDSAVNLGRFKPVIDGKLWELYDQAYQEGYDDGELTNGVVLNDCV